jgi:opacity protein-like surface antigen
LALSSPARAGESEPAIPPPSDAHLRGVEIALRPTVGGAGGDAPVTIADADAPRALRAGSSTFKWAAGVGMQVGWRFHPFVSAGFRFDLGRVSTDDPSNETKDLARETMGAGLYTRIYPLALSESTRRHFDPWLGVGAGYGRDVVSFTLPDGKNQVAVEAQRHAIAVPIGIGFDYRVTEWMSVGPSFEYAIVNPVAGCVKASVGAASEQVCTGDTRSNLVASSAGAWNAGVMLRVTPF